MNLPKTLMDGFIVSAFAIHLGVAASVVVIRLDWQSTLHCKSVENCLLPSLVNGKPVNVRCSRHRYLPSSQLQKRSRLKWCMAWPLLTKLWSLVTFDLGLIIPYMQAPLFSMKRSLSWCGGIEGQWVSRYVIRGWQRISVIGFLWWRRISLEQQWQAGINTFLLNYPVKVCLYNNWWIFRN